MHVNDKYDIETKTILHYAKKIKEYCNSHKCEKCELSKGDTICYFFSFPYNWEEVDLHDERQHMDPFTTDN